MNNILDVIVQGVVLIGIPGLVALVWRLNVQVAVLLSRVSEHDRRLKLLERAA